MRTDEQRTAKREIISNIVNQGGWELGKIANHNPTKEKNN